MMRHFAFSGLLILAGCMDDYSSEPARHRRTPEPSAVCPGNDCFGMHQYKPPSKCQACGVGGLQTVHYYCKGCASRLERCAHCGRKSPAKSAERAETPPPPPPATPPPTPPPPAPTPAPPTPAPKPEKSAVIEQLDVEPVDLSDEQRRSHSVIAFAANSDQSKSAFDTHRRHKEAEIAKLPSPRVHRDPGLYLVWGYYPPPIITEKDVKATFDEKTGMIRITLPPFPRRLPEGGIGMDWGVDKDKDWPFVGFRVKLNTLPAGTYSFDVVEVDVHGKNPRLLSSGKIELKKN